MTEPKEKLVEDLDHNPKVKVSPWNPPFNTVVIRVPYRLKEKILNIAHILDDALSPEDLKLISTKELKCEIDTIFRAKKSFQSSFERLKIFIDNLDPQ